MGNPSTYTSWVLACDPNTCPAALLPPGTTPGMYCTNAVGSRGALPMASGSAVYSSLRTVCPTRASLVFTIGAAAVTVADSADEPILSDRFTPTVANASTVRCSCTVFSKPAEDTAIVYLPAGSGEIT